MACLLIGQECFSQCYTKLRQEGVTFFYNGKYSDAKRIFEVTKQRCDDIPSDHDLNSWIQKCNKAMSAKPATTKATTTPVSQTDDNCLQDCYIAPLEFAVATYNNKNYISALDVFLQITECPCVPSVNDLSLWIEECRKMISVGDCIENCYAIYYQNGEDFFTRDLFKEAEEAFTKANLCGCTPNGSDVIAKIDHSKKMKEDQLEKTLRIDSIAFTLWETRGFYEGYVQFGTAHGGEGKCTFVNHPHFRSISAVFMNGKPIGNVEILFINGEKYTGRFDDNQFNTNGSYTFPNGDVYQGEYVDYKPEGTGKMKYKNGDLYEGAFKAGKRNGQGKLTVTFNHFIEHAENSRIYDGEWSDDMKMGWGKCYDGEGKLLHEGIFKNDFPEQNYPNRVLKLAMDFVDVEGGKFQMGCTEEAAGYTANERPRHEVTVSSFSISKYEITVAQYRQFCKETGHPMPPQPAWGWVNEHPIVNVSWYDAQAFCEWNNCRLPTEAEWEYAAKGGKNSKGYTYSGGNQPNGVAIFEVNANHRVQLVGKKTPNELGIYDMSGNVAEWCSDYFGSYAPISQTDPAGADRGTTRVIRGGSWTTTEKECRTAYRSRSQPNLSTSGVGFRVVKF